MRLTLPLATLALLAVAAIPVAAQTAPAAPQAAPASSQPAPHAKRAHLSLEKRFEEANTTHDGHLTRDQASASKLMRTVSENFGAVDKDHKGYVTEDDIRAWYKARREARKQAKEQAAHAKS